METVFYETSAEMSAEVFLSENLSGRFSCIYGKKQVI
jgi:hypothetical protein